MRGINSPNYAVRFGETVDKGMAGEPVLFPFFYNFVRDEEDNWEQVKGGGTVANLTGIGPSIPAGGHVVHPIRLDADYAFMLLWIKFTCYHPPELGLAGYRWYEPHANWDLDIYDYETQIGTPLYRFIRASVSLQGPDGRMLYGGSAIDNLSGGQYNGKIPINIQGVQGYDYGMGQLHTPYFLPREGLVMLELNNIHTVKTLVVGGCLYGMKVRM